MRFSNLSQKLLYWGFPPVYVHVARRQAMVLLMVVFYESIKVSYPVVIGIPIMGHSMYTANATTAIRMTLAGSP